MLELNLHSHPTEKTNAVMCFLTERPSHLFLNAIALGRSLQVHSSDSYDSVIVVDEHYDEQRRQILELFWDKVIQVPNIKKAMNWPDDTDTRANLIYAYMFTQYEKVLILDADTLLTNKIDEIFSFEAPGLVVRDKDVRWQSRTPAQSEHVICPNKGQMLRMSGIFLIEPDMEEAEDLISGYTDMLNRGERLTYGHFLCLYNQGIWYTISGQYAFRPDYLFNTKSQTAKAACAHDVSIIHYPGAIKASDIFFFSEELLQIDPIVPQTINTIVNKVRNWSTLPKVARNQSVDERLEGLYGEWFARMTEALGEIYNKLQIPLGSVHPATPNTDMDELQKIMNERHERNSQRSRFKVQSTNTSSSKARAFETSSSANVVRLPLRKPKKMVS